MSRSSTAAYAGRYFGKVCAKHPELKGKRYRGSLACIYCRSDELYRARQTANARLTPAAKKRVKALQAEARRRTAETGYEWVVDHDVPLARGGKHHPDNMHVLPASMNRLKGARYANTWEFLMS